MRTRDSLVSSEHKSQDDFGIQEYPCFGISGKHGFRAEPYPFQWPTRLIHTAIRGRSSGIEDFWRSSMLDLRSRRSLMRFDGGLYFCDLPFSDFGAPQSLHLGLITNAANLRLMYTIMLRKQTAIREEAVTLASLRYIKD
ncbi:hypothetical protein AC579_10624 [Pseudocercospora musae]|uniref:Uncharacterized protein n=1 Tax=Pseudocercospora musae TaxID=113226 RepID=A0A139IKZ3_9PEZI|nr:hypothetical protein AC579_10624 [Pseudocercospora musae]